MSVRGIANLLSEFSLDVLEEKKKRRKKERKEGRKDRTQFLEKWISIKGASKMEVALPLRG